MDKPTAESAPLSPGTTPERDKALICPPMAPDGAPFPAGDVAGWDEAGEASAESQLTGST